MNGSALIEETRQHLRLRPALNRVNGPVSAGASSVAFDFDLGPIQSGATVAVGLEVMYVWSVNANAKTATVQRGMLGSTDAAHSDGDIVYVNPHGYSPWEIWRALGDELNDLSSPSNGLFRVVTTTATFNSSIYGYDLAGATDVLDVLEVKADESGPETTWPTLRPDQYILKRESDTTDFASGFSVVLSAGVESGRPLRITYAAPFTAMTALTDDVTTDAGLPATASDIPPLGAALRLSWPDEVSRNVTHRQSDTRRAEEVPPGAQLRAPQGLAALRETRIAAEASRLRQQWPIRRA